MKRFIINIPKRLSYTIVLSRRKDRPSPPSPEKKLWNVSFLFNLYVIENLTFVKKTTWQLNLSMAVKFVNGLVFVILSR